MKQRVYVETSVISYVTAWPSRDLIVAAHQEITRQWWNDERGKYDLYISQAVIGEASAGDAQAATQRLALLDSFPLLDINEDVEKLARDFLAAGAMPPQAELDALHVAVPHGMVQNTFSLGIAGTSPARVRPRIDALCRSRGIASPQLCTPEELMEA